jgi:hypothetical protein
MSQIQNSCLNTKNLLEPAVLFGLAFLAGSTRMIHYLPGASQSGLLVAAGLASTASYLYDPTLNDPEYSDLKAIAWKGATIALATVCTSLLAKPLKGRVDLSFKAAATFGLAEFVAIAILTKATEPTALEHTHHYYTTHLKDWHILSRDERTELVKAFYEASLPAISLWNNTISTYNFLDTYAVLQKNLDSYSGAQLSWYCELLPKDRFPDRPTQQRDGNWVYPANHEFYFPLMQRCQQTGITMFRWTMNQSHLNYLRNKPELIEMLAQEFRQSPLYRCYCQMKNNGREHGLWDDAFLLQDKEETFLSLVDIMEQLDPSKVQTMDADHLRIWYGIFTQQSHNWGRLSEPTQTAFLIQFFELGYPPLVQQFTDSFVTYINALSTDYIVQLNPRLWAFYIQQHSPHKMAFQHVYALNQKPENAGHQLPYFLSSEVVQAAEKDPALVQQLITQLSRSYVEDNGLSSLSPEYQARLKLLFGEKYQHLLNGPQIDEELF